MAFDFVERSAEMRFGMAAARNGFRQAIRIDVGNRLFARGVDVSDDDAIGVQKGRPEIFPAITRTRIAMGLEDRSDPPPNGCYARPLGWLGFRPDDVAVVVDDFDAVSVSLSFESSRDTREGGERVSEEAGVDALFDRDRNRSKRIQDVMPTGHE